MISLLHRYLIVNSLSASFNVYLPLRFPQMFFSQNRIHRPVKCFRRNFTADLEGETDSDIVRVEFGEQAVVISFSPAEPASVGVEGDTGDDPQVDPVEIGKDFTGRFFDSVGSGTQILFAGIYAEFQFVADHYREQDRFAPFPFLHEVVGVDFIGE